jgi:hypothetical protein
MMESNSTPKRIVYMVATGGEEYREMALGLARSLRFISDQTPRVIATDIEGVNWSQYFDQVVPHDGKRTALDKLKALETTDADQVLALDIDMLAFKRLDPIFDYCKGREFAVQEILHDRTRFHGTAFSEIESHYGLSVPRFNGGLVYYERTDLARKLITDALDRQEAYTEFKLYRGNPSEETCMLDAMMKTPGWHLIPAHKEFQHTAAGLVGKLHMDVMRRECQFVSRQKHTHISEPYLFHAWRYKDFACYWKQIKLLEGLAKYEEKYESIRMSRWAGISRSIQKRWMKLTGLRP